MDQSIGRFIPLVAPTWPRKQSGRRTKTRTKGENAAAIEQIAVGILIDIGSFRVERRPPKAASKVDRYGRDGRPFGPRRCSIVRSLHLANKAATAHDAGVGRSRSTSAEQPVRSVPAIGQGRGYRLLRKVAERSDTFVFLSRRAGSDPTACKLVRLTEQPSVGVPIKGISIQIFLKISTRPGSQAHCAELAARRINGPWMSMEKKS